MIYKKIITIDGVSMNYFLLAIMFLLTGYNIDINAMNKKIVFSPEPHKPTINLTQHSSHNNQSPVNNSPNKFSPTNNNVVRQQQAQEQDTNITQTENNTGAAVATVGIAAAVGAIAYAFFEYFTKDDKRS